MPGCKALLSASNEGGTLDSFDAMGARLAKELVDYLAPMLARSQVLLDTASGRAVGPQGGMSLQHLLSLSFVAHSQGGIVVRAALAQPVLSSLLPCCQNFVSLGSPHLGWLHGESRLVTAAMQLLRLSPACAALRELTLHGEDPEKSSLFRLSADQNRLSHFQNVALVASKEVRPWAGGRASTEWTCHRPLGRSHRIATCPSARPAWCPTPARSPTAARVAARTRRWPPTS